MTDAPTVSPKTPNAWLSAEPAPGELSFAGYVTRFRRPIDAYAGIAENDWIVLADFSANATRIGRVLRVRSDLDTTTVYFDRVSLTAANSALASAGLPTRVGSSPTRIQWNDFLSAVRKFAGGTIDDIPLVDDQAYIRELLQLAVVDDLLGPANGPRERIVDMSVRDRYLVGKLAPREADAGGIEGLEGPLATDEDDDEPNALDVHSGRHDPGAEFDSSSGNVDAEADAADEIDASSNQSLVPSSFGLTFCVDGAVDRIEIEARWGQYARIYEHEHTKTVNRKIKDAEGNVIRTEQVDVPVKVWERVPCGGPLTIDLHEGVLSHRAPDAEHPDVRI